MSSAKVLSFEPDSLFEQHNISEIDQIHKKLQNDIERKKEELRTNVGERYRDLMKAADTIGDMKNTSAGIVNDIDQIIVTLRNLNEQQLMGFKTEEPDYKKTINRNTNNNYYGIVVQIKLLTALPELIWTCIDKDQFFIAAQLFVFSRHISTGLQLDTNSSIMKWFPVAKKQWNLLNPFYFTIKQTCLAALEKPDLSPETATTCLASLMLLENSNIDKLMTVLIQLRGKAFLNSLSETDSNHEMAKSKILKSIRILIETIELLYKVLIYGGAGCENGLLIKEIKYFTEEDAKPTISFVEIDSSILGQTVPDIIAKFKPHIKEFDIKLDVMKTVMTSWLSYIENISKNQLKSLIDLITTVKTIDEIKKSILTIEKPSEWSKMCSEISLPTNMDLYQLYYQPLFNLRIREVVKTSWTKILDCTSIDVKKLLESKDKNLRSTKNFVWNENIVADIPKSLKEALSDNMQAHKLLMKSKGFSPPIVEFCNSLDQKFDHLLQDFSMFLKNDVLGKKSDLDRKEFDDLTLFFKEYAKKGVTEMITQIKSISIDSKDDGLVLILARLLQAISELVPNLKLCLSFNVNISWNDDTSISHSDYWNNVKGLLEDESFRFWKLWVDQIDQYIVNASKQSLIQKIDSNTVLRDYPKWENFTIEEKDELDNLVQSTIHVPSQLCFSVQQFLNDICCEINKAVPHTIPKSILVLLNECILNELYSFYKSISENEFIKTNQNSALQYFFDTKFISILLVSRDNKIMLDNFHNLSNTIKSFIDPFDFELFYNYLNSNVKKSCHRMKFLFGCIVTNMENLSSITGKDNQENDPTVITRSLNSSETHWFPLLPIMTRGHNNKDGQDVVQHEKLTKSRKVPSTTTTTTTTTNNPSVIASNVKSSAAAFFGAMSQDWFK